MENTKIYGKLLLFQRNINAIKKDATNPHFKNTYATLTHILSEVKPVLSDLGLVIMQPIEGGKVNTHLIDSETGELISASIDLPTGLNPQQVGSAITYYRRYLLASILSLEIEDDDANEASKPASGATDDGKVWLNDNTDQFIAAVKYLEEGGKIGEIEKKYKLSKKVREQLIAKAA